MKITCPKCGSDQISANKKGFSGGKALAGAVLTGGVGLLAGTIGSSKVLCTCLACGNSFPAGKGKIVYEPGEAPAAAAMEDQARRQHNRSTNKVILTVFAAVVVVLIILVVVLGS